jgi:hypothetical protein
MVAELAPTTQLIPYRTKTSWHAAVLRARATHLDTACERLATCVCNGNLLLQHSHLILQALSDSNIVVLLLSYSRHGE